MERVESRVIAAEAVDEDCAMARLWQLHCRPWLYNARDDTASDKPRIAAGDHAVSVSPTRGVVRLLQGAIILFATTILMDQDYDQERYFNPSISFICGSSDFQ
jgi:hypothetical protein